MSDEHELQLLRPEGARGNAFLPFPLDHGMLYEAIRDAHPSRLSAWRDRMLELRDDGTHFGYVYEGNPTLEVMCGNFTLKPGMYFAAPGRARVRGAGTGIVVTRLAYKGVFTLGGVVEARGRLRYIDGCTDSLLIPPPVCGDPCLNALYFPDGITQTEHTHPSVRIGLVARGTGECVTPDGATRLTPGLAFVIPAGARHNFTTRGEEMIVIAYHPDSDTGPTHEAHPMITRTIVEGVPASQLDRIRTRKETLSAP